MQDASGKLSIIDEIAAERRRWHQQIEEEGWAPAHDDAHRNGELAGAAACYVMHLLPIPNDYLRRAVARMVIDLWPWSAMYWKPKDRRCSLIRAAALIVAEIERLDRRSEASEKVQAGAE